MTWEDITDAEILAWAQSDITGRDVAAWARQEAEQLKPVWPFQGVFDLDQIKAFTKAHIDEAEWVEGPCGERRRTLVIETLVSGGHGVHIPSMVLELFGETDGYGPEDPHYTKEEWIYDTLTLLENTITDALNELLLDDTMPAKGYYYVGFHEYDGSYCLFYEEYEYEEDDMMKEIEVVVIEAGPDYLERLESFEMEVPEDEEQAVSEAIEAVEARGYTVLPDNCGGCCAYVSMTDGEDYIAITVEPSAEEEEGK
jgi:hypothetical protein